GSGQVAVIGERRIRRDSVGVAKRVLEQNGHAVAGDPETDLEGERGDDQPDDRDRESHGQVPRCARSSPYVFAGELLGRRRVGGAACPHFSSYVTSSPRLGSN